MKLMITAAVAVLALAISGCSATNSLSPQPGIAGASVEPSPTPEAQRNPAPNATGCHEARDTFYYNRFRSAHTHLSIHAPEGYVAITGYVENWMNVPVFFRGNDGHHGWYAPPFGTSGAGGSGLIDFGKNVTVVILSVREKPSSGYIKAHVKWCLK
ncbi:MAG: hypothetical protein WB438_04270 [Candidatus Cybelea sp.]